jgi:RNA polymerase sigma-70 factor (ECF subfamily)
MLSNTPDDKIVENILNGNKESFDIIVDRYQNKVFAMVNRRIPKDDVPDIAQEAFLKVYHGLDKYVPGGTFENWLSVITLRCCCDYFRRQKRYKLISAPAFDAEKHAQWLEKISAEISLEVFNELSQVREAGELLGWALGKLAPDDRTLIEMVHLDGYSFKEAAEVLEWKLSKTKVRAMRVRKKLKRIISEYTQMIYGGDNEK